MHCRYLKYKVTLLIFIYEYSLSIGSETKSLFENRKSSQCKFKLYPTINIAEVVYSDVNSASSEKAISSGAHDGAILFDHFHV